MHKNTHEKVYSPYQWRASSLSKHILSTRLHEYYISMKMSLDNYDDLVDLRKHVQNIHSSLELIIQYRDSIYKKLPTIFRGSTYAWYNNLKPNSIEGFNDLWAKVVACFNTNMPTKKTL